MAEQMIPPWIIPEEESQEWLDEGSSVFTAQFAPGLTQRQSYGGLRLKLSRRHTVRGEEKARLLAVLSATRGRYNAVRTQVHFARRGAGLGSELLTNNTFADGTTGWDASGSSTISVADRVLRLVRGEPTTGRVARNNTSFVVSAYAPYAARLMALSGRGGVACRIRLGTTTGGTEVLETGTITSGGLVSSAVVPASTPLFYSIFDNAVNRASGDYMDFPYTSVSRCALVDNGPNRLIRSNDFSNSAWSKVRSTITPEATQGPYGTVTADSLIEDSTASSTHYVSQFATKPATDQDWCGVVHLKANSRSQGYVQIGESGTNFSLVIVDLATGAIIGGPSNVGSISNARASVTNVGNGWFRVSLVARIPSSITTTNLLAIGVANGGVSSYTGDGTSGIYVDDAAYAQSSVPMFPTHTETVVTAGASQTGSALNLKGLPASTSGILLAGDFFEVNGELKQCTAALNSDAAGLGYLQFEPDLVRPPADNDPVILTDPMGKFLVSNIKIDNQFGTQAIVTYDLEHIYD